jgi:single stranded DNA-binding protein
MNDINQVFYMGRLTRDAKFTDKGAFQMTDLVIASNYEPRKPGADKEVCFIKCTLWNKEAEIASQLKKGDEVMVIGRLKFGKWIDKKTELEVTGHSIVATQIMYNDKLSEFRQEEEVKQVRLDVDTRKPQPAKKQVEESFDDGLPF